MANRLAHGASPYLLQHGANPVGWQEWGPEAFAEARTRDVPVIAANASSRSRGTTWQNCVHWPAGCA
jgi:uncharacterized protein YyaL (SSP411 family)